MNDIIQEIAILGRDERLYWKDEYVFSLPEEEAREIVKLKLKYHGLVFDFKLLNHFKKEGIYE